MPTLLSLFPLPHDLLALTPEDLAGILVEVTRGDMQSPRFMVDTFVNPLFPVVGDGYPPTSKNDVVIAIAEAMSWMETQGLIVRDPTQPAAWYIFTRRGRTLKTRTDIEAFRKGRTLPIELLQSGLASKVHHLFLRGDHDTAVFQAFKEVEIAVRIAGKYPDSVVGRDLMTKAFNKDTGPLRNPSLIASEQEAKMFLFVGAIGHAKNPSSHREVGLSREEAARLIVFASHLLDLVASRP